MEPRSWILVATLMTMGCGGATSLETPSSHATFYVGTLDSSDAIVASVVENDRVTTYVCGGSSTYESMSVWLSGDVVSGHFSKQQSGFQIDASFDGSLAWGTVRTAQGVEHTWSARATSMDSAAGLYSVMDEGCRTGVIVLPPDANGNLRAQGTWCSADGLHAQVTPVRPLERIDGYMRVWVNGIVSRPSRLLQVQRMQTPLPR